MSHKWSTQITEQQHYTARYLTLAILTILQGSVAAACCFSINCLPVELFDIHLYTNLCDISYDDQKVFAAVDVVLNVVITSPISADGDVDMIVDVKSYKSEMCHNMSCSCSKSKKLTPCTTPGYTSHWTTPVRLTALLILWHIVDVGAILFFIFPSYLFSSHLIEDLA